MRKRRSKYHKLNNREITRKYDFVNLVTSDGLKKMTSQSALELALDQDLDLVMVSNGKDNPICKILDYKKYIYEQKKKDKASKKKSSKVQNKEIRLSLDIGISDMKHKAKKAIEFLNDGAILNLTLRIKSWRNMGRKSQGEEKIRQFFDIISDVVEYEVYFDKEPKLNGRNWTSTVKIK